MRVFILISICLNAICGFSQISSPGLGRQQSAAWFAIGLKEDLDTASKIQSMTYIGLGRESKISEDAFFKHQGILVINQEFYSHFRKHWQYSVALSYRKQNEYLSGEPYRNANPAYKQEFRAYGRFMYLQQWSRLKLALTLRQEFRRFYEPDFDLWKEDFQFRTRLKLQPTFYLTENKVHRLTLGGELLFTKSQFSSGTWSPFKYSESRLTLFYSFAPKNKRLIYSIGYMDDVVDDTNIPYVSFDVILKNPFGISRRLKSKSVEYGE